VVTKVPEHVRVHPGDAQPGELLESVQRAGGGVPVDPAPGPVQQNRPGQPVGNGTVDGRWHRHQDGLVSFPTTRTRGGRARRRGR
jgi:hypothetical protein